MKTGNRITNALMIVVAAIAIGGLTVGLANAAEIIDSTGITSSAGEGVAGSHISRVINGSGLSAALTIDNYRTVTHNAGYQSASQWLELNVNGETVTFSFTGAPTITEIVLWNYTQVDKEDRTLQEISKVEVDTGAGFVDLGLSFALREWTAGANTADVLIIGQNQDVVAIRITLVQNNIDLGAYSGGLSEVAFTDADLPAPGTLIYGK